MTKDAFSDHGLVTSEEVFAFSNSPAGPAAEAGPIVEARLFSTAASRTPPSPPLAEKPVQVPPTAAATSVQAHAPQEPPLIPVAADAAPVAVAAPAQPMEVVPPRMLELTDRVLLESPRPPDVLRPMSHVRQWKKAAELAAVIEHDLAQHPDSPKQGLRVTVYGGGADWRAMLMFLPAAGPVRNAQQLREVTEHLAEGLRQRYSLAWD